jgi:hypothetical protein
MKLLHHPIIHILLFLFYVFSVFAALTVFKLLDRLVEGLARVPALDFVCASVVDHFESIPFSFVRRMKSLRWISVKLFVDET